MTGDPLTETMKIEAESMELSCTRACDGSHAADYSRLEICEGSNIEVGGCGRFRHSDRCHDYAADWSRGLTNHGHAADADLVW
jgi:hypothetical protein